MLLQGRWRTRDEGGRWWAFRCDGCGSERAMRAESPGHAAAGLGLKTIRIADAEDRLEHYCPVCQRKGA
jgi:hypothetical protein